MDAVKFLVECHNYCEDCRAKAKDEPPKYHRCFGCYFDSYVGGYPQKGAEIVVGMIERILEEKKAKAKTRQNDFLKSHPNARRCFWTTERVLDVCPNMIDQSYECKAYEHNAADGFCTVCKKRLLACANR